MSPRSDVPSSVAVVQVSLRPPEPREICGRNPTRLSGDDQPRKPPSVALTSAVKEQIGGFELHLQTAMPFHFRVEERMNSSSCMRHGVGVYE